jgi:hypothetical protein
MLADLRDVVEALEADQVIPFSSRWLNFEQGG